MMKGKPIIRPLPEPKIWEYKPEPPTRREKLEVLLIVMLPISIASAYLIAMCLWAICQAW